MLLKRLVQKIFNQNELTPIKLFAPVKYRVIFLYRRNNAVYIFRFAIRVLGMQQNWLKKLLHDCHVVKFLDWTSQANDLQTWSIHFLTLRELNLFGLNFLVLSHHLHQIMIGIY